MMRMLELQPGDLRVSCLTAPCSVRLSGDDGLPLSTAETEQLLLDPNRRLETHLGAQTTAGLG
jgi:hypothetical protein